MIYAEGKSAHSSLYNLFQVSNRFCPVGSTLNPQSIKILWEKADPKA
jgi:hypothetical protein